MAAKSFLRCAAFNLMVTGRPAPLEQVLQSAPRRAPANPRISRDKSCRRDLADGNRLAVQKFSVAGTVFNRVADGVAEIQNGAQAAFGFVLADDFRLDFAAARDDGGERLRFAPEQFRQVAFELREQISRRK